MFYIDPNSSIFEEISRRVWPDNKADSFNVEENGWEIQIKNNLDEAFHRHWFKQNYIPETETETETETENQRTNITHH